MTNEKQKKVTDEYRNNWDQIFKKPEVVLSEFKMKRYGAYKDENGDIQVGEIKHD